MDFRITIDISARFEHAINNLADAMPRHPFANYCDYDDRSTFAKKEFCLDSIDRIVAEQRNRAQIDTAERVSESEAPVTQPAPENPQTTPTETQETAIQGCIAENPAHELTSQTAPAPVDKPKKKKAPKKPVDAPEPAPEPEAVVTQPAPEPAATAPTAPQETAKSDNDPMSGMTVVDAVQALVNEIRDKDIDMATVNARVRAKANEIGLAYASAACLIKAIGYVEARRVALGEK